MNPYSVFVLALLAFLLAQLWLKRIQKRQYSEDLRRIASRHGARNGYSE